MYYLRDEACASVTITEEEYSWLVEQLRAKRASDLKKSMAVYMDTFGVAVACEKCNKGTVKKMS